MGCAIFGLPTTGESQTGESHIELDVLGQYYTVCTRSRLKMILFIDRQQFDYLRNVGWRDIKAETASIFDLSTQSPDKPSERIPRAEPALEVADEVAAFLARIGLVDLDPDAMRAAGEKYFQNFREQPDEPSLRESIACYEHGGWYDEAAATRRQGAQIFEQRERYEQALAWYLQINEPVSAVRCCTARIKQLTTSGGETKQTEIERLRGIAYNQAEGLEGLEAFSEAAKCWEILEEFDKAVRCSLQANDPEAAERLVEQVSEEDKQVGLYKQVITSYIDLVEVRKGAIDATRLQRAEPLVERLPVQERLAYYRSIA